MTYSTINTEINRIQENIQNSYDIAEQLGATLPQDKNSDNLSACLDTINNYPLIPSRLNGLCLWLDGDCNTRKGLDRSKKYFENLVWNVPVTTITGNREIFPANTSIWHDNILELKTYSKYPLISSGTLTIELVAVKIADSDSFLVSFANRSNFGFELSKKLFSIYIRLQSGFKTFSSSSFIQPDLGVIRYVVYTHDANKKQVKLYNPADDVIDTFTYTESYVSPSALYDCGFGTHTDESTADRYSGTEIGMCRMWNRVLTDSEIQANYNDAKKRFGCI